MRFAIELLFDNEADSRVRCIWNRLDASGIPALSSEAGSNYYPHVSLAVFEEANLAEVWAAAIAPAKASLGLRLRLATIGFFVTEESVAFLGVVPTQELLAVHRNVVTSVLPLVSGYRDYYQPDALVPHCTLARYVHDQAKVTHAIALSDLPIDATVNSVHLVEIPGGQLHYGTSLPGSLL